MTYEEIAASEGFSVNELQRGYGVFDLSKDIRVVQKLDCLDQYNANKFLNDLEAGEQALKDGYNVVRGKGYYNGLYVVAD